ncbi:MULTISPECIES: S-4TM family putative pore-forming effector [Bacillota]|uniref:S-4TM family putative pore-forming effector n=2 Tax=Bacillota TaxID=1239 RepID=A0A9X3XUT1_ENTFC|nr:MULTISPECIES: S-4TM family putative pore-forming effector [Bacillota]MDC4242845.1 S-4TM family putative pore-forming effector [Clostridium tertium]MDC4249321.1 S-4TM family putative pore-forming effector [Enterococcus faecium]
MNNIATSQNKEENLLLLYSQKILYDKSKNTKYFTVLLSVFNFLLGIISSSILEYKTICLIFIFLIMCFSKYLQNNSNKFNDLAASTQELIDRRLFNFEVESRHLGNHTISELISVANDLKEKYPKKYLINISHTGTDTPNGVKDWYTNIAPSLSINEAILKCQKQNIYWDECLIKYYRNILKVLCFFIAIILLFFYWNQSVFNLILGIISSFSILEIIIKEFSLSSKYISNSIAIDSIISTLYNSDFIDTKNIKDLQSRIFARRKSEFNVPSFIHKLNRIKLHYKYNRDN